jgi:hypothetical protein
MSRTKCDKGKRDILPVQNDIDRATVRCCLSLNLHSDKRNISAVLGNVKKQGKATPGGRG